MKLGIYLFLKYKQGISIKSLEKSVLVLRVFFKIIQVIPESK